MSSKADSKRSKKSDLERTPASHVGGVLPDMRWLWALLVLAAVETGLAVYQWFELLKVKGGGDVACSISETVDCASVWTSGFAERMEGLFGIPVAAMGVVWGLTAVAVSTVLLLRVAKKRPHLPLVGSVRIVAIVGVLASITFAAASFAAGAVCPTCVVTYLLVVGYAAIAFAALGKPFFDSGSLGAAFGWAAVPALLTFLALWFPTLGKEQPSLPSTPPSPVAQVQPTAPATPPRPLNERERQADAYIRSLPVDAQQGLALALAAYRAAPVIEPDPAHQPRRLFGPPDAPMKLVEWTDGLCPHCATLVQRLDQLKTAVPGGLMSVEARHFPLARECNPTVQGSDPSGVRCAIARAQVCLEQAPDYWQIRSRIFAGQRSYRTVDQVLNVASSGSVNRQTLEACMSKPETQEAINADARAGMAHGLRGTPLVVVNGRTTSANETFLYVLALAGGDPNSPAFYSLPQARMP